MNQSSHFTYRLPSPPVHAKNSLPELQVFDMNIAHVNAPHRGETNRLLTRIAQVLAQEGRRLCGTVQTDTETTRSHLCDMDVTVLPDGPVVRISQDLGTEAKGCRINASALETCVAMTLANIRDGADLVIINKFGKQEADGRGFRDAVAEAMSRDIPVLLGVNDDNRDALETFCEGHITALEPDLDAVLAWARDVTQRPD